MVGRGGGGGEGMFVPPNVNTVYEYGVRIRWVGVVVCYVQCKGGLRRASSREVCS